MVREVVTKPPAQHVLLRYATFRGKNGVSIEVRAVNKEHEAEAKHFSVRVSIPKNRDRISELINEFHNGEVITSEKIIKDGDTVNFINDREAEEVLTNINVEPAGGTLDEFAKQDVAVTATLYTATDTVMRLFNDLGWGNEKFKPHFIEGEFSSHVKSYITSLITEVVRSAVNPEIPKLGHHHKPFWYGKDNIHR